MNLFHKGPFIMRNEHQVSYRLPQARYQVNLWFYERSVICDVLDTTTFNTMQTMNIHKDRCPTWKDIVWGFEELAAKKYALDVMQRRRSC
jgi:hypothetical protein